MCSTLSDLRAEPPSGVLPRFSPGLDSSVFSVDRACRVCIFLNIYGSSPQTYCLLCSFNSLSQFRRRGRWHSELYSHDLPAHAWSPCFESFVTPRYAIMNAKKRGMFFLPPLVEDVWLSSEPYIHANTHTKKE